MANKEPKEAAIKNLTRSIVQMVATTTARDELEDKNEMEKMISKMPVKAENYDCFREQCAALKRDTSKIRQLIQDGVSDLLRDYLSE